MNAEPRKRVLFHSGRIVKRKDPKPCHGSSHVGPLLRAELYDQFPDGQWRGFGDCAVCGSTIHKSQLRGKAA